MYDLPSMAAPALRWSLCSKAASSTVVFLASLSLTPSQIIAPSFALTLRPPGFIGGVFPSFSEVIDARLVKATRVLARTKMPPLARRVRGRSMVTRIILPLIPDRSLSLSLACTAANVHDSQVTVDLLEGDEGAIFADEEVPSWR